MTDGLHDTEIQQDACTETLASNTVMRSWFRAVSSQAPRALAPLFGMASKARCIGLSRARTAADRPAHGCAARNDFVEHGLRVLALVASAALTACSSIPRSGPSTRDVEQANASVGNTAVQVIDIDSTLSRQLSLSRQQRLFSELPASAAPVDFKVGAGDGVEVSIWETPPATLFGTGIAEGPQGAALSVSRATVLPAQVVDSQGFITVPFAGRVPAAGRDVLAIQTEIAARLRTKAHQPEVIVRVVHNASSVATVVGEVNTSLRMPLTPSGERVLDALAAAGGTRQSVSKTTVQLTRGSEHVSVPLDRLIRDPGQNIRLQAGDVLTAITQPLSFTALGATGKNEEISFETQGVSLAQALARSGGLLDNRSDAQGVFIFRLEPQTALDWPRKPVFATPEGLVPVVYRLNLRDPASFFVMQGFAVRDKDVLYISNAPLSEVQKFLNVVFSVAFPVLNLIQVTR